MKNFFKIIIPNYNNDEWLEKCINSILNQTFQDFHIIIIDDVSTDNSKDIILKLFNEHSDKISYIFLNNKRFNGGTRNVGIEFDLNSEYTLFIDSDDSFVDNNCLQDIYDLIQSTKAECIRLSYNAIRGDNVIPVILTETTPAELVDNVNVACWLKVVKTDLVQRFTENTLMEDAVYNIKQCDVINSVVPIKKPIINWNRNNKNSTSINTNQQNNKWASSQYRYCADLMDLKCNHDYCEKERQARLNACIRNINNGRITQDK